MTRTPFWLSHHAPADHDRCLRVGGLALCARCLGTYPLMLLAVAAQIAARAPMAGRFDAVVALALPIPALVDWARGRFDPRTGTNAMRLLTGALLGLSVGRTLYLHLRHPPHPLLLAQVALLATAAAVVEVLARRRRLAARTDPNRRPDVEDDEQRGRAA